jgi:phenylpropionate dioxygenase-like ring-hydroxylating dioxygenase large terminal subunit
MNLRGAERALATGRIDQLGAVCVATDRFAMANQGQTSDESVEAAKAIVALAREHGRTAQVTIGASFGCPFEGEVSQYRFEEMERMAPVRLRPRGVNWKNVGDNYSDNLHIPVAHDGLTRLVGKTYRIEAHGWADRLYGDVVKNEKQNFWERFYREHLPRVEHLPEEAHGRWLYYKLWPNMALDIYADQIDFMQWLPISPTECLLREVAYALPDSRREMKLTRYANWRINRVVNAEDTWLITRVQQGMQSKTYGNGPIGQSEVCLRSFARKIRALIPEARQPFAPAAGWSKQ